MRYVPHCYNTSTAAGMSRPSVIILNADNIVFTEIRAGLDLDEYEVITADIFYSVVITFENINMFAGTNGDPFFSKGDNSGTINHIPVFRAFHMPLQAQTFSRTHRNPFNLVSIGIGKDFVITPGADIIFHII